MIEIKKALSIYEQVITPEFVRKVLHCSGAIEREGIFQSSIVLWLMIFQRLRQATLAEAVEELRRGGSRQLLKQASGSIRARTKTISSGTGGIAQARKRLLAELVKQACDALNNEIITIATQSPNEDAKRVYIIDGSTIRTTHTKKNIKNFPQYLNQHGKAHFPLVRISLATHALSGVALRPAYGPYNGDKAVGELTLAPEVLSRLPRDSIVIGDRYYGCTRFALDAQRYGHQVICRVKEGHCTKYVDKTPCGERAVEWVSQKGERINGRFIWETIRRPKDKKPFRLILFTTTAHSSKQLLDLYALRWNVELDLRDIKSTLEADFLDCKSPEMFEKELFVAVTAYNLVRHTLMQMANAAKIPYRRFSFSRVLIRLRVLESVITCDTTPLQEKEFAIAQALMDYKSLLLPDRKRKRANEPRKVWPKGHFAIMRKSRKAERAKLNNSKS